MGNLNICSSKDVFIENLTNGTITNTQISFIKDSKEIFTQGEYWGGDLNNKVDKVIGKQLSTEDFTSALKDKLQTLQNYDDAGLISRIDAIQETIDTLFSKDVSSAIESFNEIIAFLEGVEDSESLDNIIASIESQLADKAEKTDIPTVTDILKSVYPVGAVYISTVSTGPATLFGFGTGERIKDTFLLAAGDTYTAGSTGGEAEHKLTYAELPSTVGDIIMHGATTGTQVGDVGGCFTPAVKVDNRYLGRPDLTNEGASSIYKIRYNNGGKDEAHNNMPPYLAVYMWKRTA